MKVGGDFLFNASHMQSFNDLLFIAGGVGINPLYSIIQEINESLRDGVLEDRVNVQLLYSSSTFDELIFRVSY